MSDKEDFFDKLFRETVLYSYYYDKPVKKKKYKRPSFLKRLQARAEYYEKYNESRTEEQKLQDEENLRKAKRFLIISTLIITALSIIYYVFIY